MVSSSSMVGKSESDSTMIGGGTDHKAAMRDNQSDKSSIPGLWLQILHACEKSPMTRYMGFVVILVLAPYT